MLLPKKVKHRKWHKLRRRDKGVATRTNTVAFGEFGLCAQGHSWISSRQIEATRKVLTRTIRRSGKMWIRVFPDRPFTAKPPEVGMGKGKGDPQGYCFQVRPGRIMFEVDGVTDAIEKEALRKGGTKLPTKTKVISRNA